MAQVRTFKTNPDHGATDVNLKCRCGHQFTNPQTFIAHLIATSDDPDQEKPIDVENST